MLCGAHTGPEFLLQPDVFRTVVLERLRLPLQITESHCECGATSWDATEPGKLRSRPVAPERALARICREAGAIVRQNVMVQDMNIIVSALDERRIEVLEYGLPLNHGAQFAIDVTLRSALTTGTAPRTNAARVDGTGFAQA